MHNKIKRRKSILLLLFIVILTVAPNTIAHAAWVEIGGWSNNGSSRAQSMNGYYGVPGYWGSWTGDATMQSPDEAMLWGRDRRISFPSIIKSDRVMKFRVFAVGYQDGTSFNVGQPDTWLTLKYCRTAEDAAAGNWITFDRQPVHGWVDDSARPTYDKQLNMVYTVGDASDPYTINTDQIWGVRCFTSDYCLDRFDAYFQKDDYPICDWAVPTDAPYSLGNEYWYKTNTDISLQTTYEDTYANLMNMYGYLTDKSDNIKIAMGIEAGGAGTTWNDYIDSSVFYDYKASWVAGGVRQRHVKYTVKANKEIEMKYKTNAINQAWGWADPNRSQALPQDSGHIVRTDGTAPITSSPITQTNQTIDTFTLNLPGLKDLQTDGSPGSGFFSANVAVWPVGGTQYENMWNNADAAGGVTRTTNVVYNATTGNMSFTYTYAPEYKGIFGKYNMHVYLYDRVGNVVCIPSIIDRGDPTPINSDLTIEKYKYKDGNVYWVNCKEPFSIKTQVKSSLSYSYSPTETILLAGDSSVYSESYDGFSSVANKTTSDITKSTEKNMYMDKSTDYFASEGEKLLYCSHDLKANLIGDGRKYKLHSLGRTEYESKWYSSNVYTSSQVLAIDGKAPEIKGNTAFNWSSEDTTINLTAEDVGSGMKSLELYDACNTKVISGTSSFYYNVSEPGVSIFKVRATDNVGNISEKYITVKIDRTAPKGNVDFNYKATSDLGINVSKVIETESGVKEIYVVYTSSNDPSKTVRETLKVNNPKVEGMAKLYNSVIGDATYNSYYDLNNDGIIDIYDLVKASNETIVNREDFNEDGIVDIEDLNLIYEHYNSPFGKSKSNSRFDLNYDGIVDMFDITLISKKIGTEYSYTGGKNLKEILGNCIKVNVKVVAVDNVDNERTLATDEFVVNATPINGKLDVTKYDYKENESSYWVKPESMFSIYTSGYFHKELAAYPDKTYLLFAKDGKMVDQSSGQYADLINKYKFGEEFDTNFKFIDDGTKAYRTEESISGNLVNILQYNHNMKAIEDGSAYKMYFANSFIAKSTRYISEYADSNKWIKVDGQAPIADKVTIQKQTTRELFLDIINLRDFSGKDNTKPGSGADLNNLYIEYQPLDLDNNPLGDKELSKERMDLFNGNYRLKVDFTKGPYKDLYGKFRIEVVSKDNVGNKSILYNYVVKRQPLAISGTITPNPSPAGKLLSVDIFTTGWANKIKVKFPDELVALAGVEEPLIIEKNIQVEPKHLEILMMRLPYESLPTIDNEGNRLIVPYNIYMECENEYGDKADGWIKLDVQGTITDNLKVRLRSTGYDKE